MKKNNNLTLYIYPGYIACRLNNKLHRENGPAITWQSGSNKWYLNDELHQIDDPAVKHTNGTKKWWLNGKHCIIENKQ